MTRTIHGRTVGRGPLSPSQITILRHMANGMTNGAIAAAMHLSVDTIKTHARRMYAHLGAYDRAHAVRLGIEAGYVPVTIRARASQEPAA
jgi:DNA-binding NarL/FixJ family response regulator